MRRTYTLRHSEHGKAYIGLSYVTTWKGSVMRIRLNELICTKCLAQGLVHSKHHVGMSYYNYYDHHIYKRSVLLTCPGKRLWALKCKILRCDVVTFPERLSVYEVTGGFTTPICAVLVKLAIANIVKGTCATMQPYKETDSHFLRVPDGAALFSKVLCRIFSTKIGVNCVPFGRERVGHCSAKIGIVQRMKFLSTDVALGWADLMNWISFQMGVFFLIANFLQFISRNSSHFAGSLWPWFGRLMYSPFDKCGFIFYFFCSSCLALPAFPLGRHL